MYLQEAKQIINNSSNCQNDIYELEAYYDNYYGDANPLYSKCKEDNSTEAWNCRIPFLKQYVSKLQQLKSKYPKDTSCHKKIDNEIKSIQLSIKNKVNRHSPTSQG